MDRLDDSEDLKAALNEHGESVAEYYLGAPRSRHSKELRWGRKGSIQLKRTQSGWSFHSYEAGVGGSLLDLIMFAETCSFADACARARQWLGDDPLPARPRPAPKQLDADDDEAARIASARSIWDAGQNIHGTPVALYLSRRALSSALDIKLVRYVSAKAIRTAAWSWWKWGAAVFRVTNDAGEVIGVQLVALNSDGTAAKHWEHDGKIKISRGSLRGGAVRFPGDDQALILAEGPETAMSCSTATGVETWAALGAIGRADLNNVPKDRTIIIACDDDPKGPSRKGLTDAIRRWRREGRAVLRAMPWALTRKDKSDFNDALQIDGIEAVRERLLSCLAPMTKADNTPILDARKDLFRVVGEQFAELLKWRGEGTAPFRAAAVTVGAGKTTAAISETVKAVKDGHTVNYLVPTHRLGDEIADRFEREASRQGVDLTVRVRRGREALNPEHPDEKMCVDLDLVREAERVHADIRETACKVCEYRTGCAYLAQDEQTADVWIAAHETMFNDMPRTMKDAALVVIDEDFASKGIKGDHHKIIVAVDQLNDIRSSSTANEADLWITLKPIRAKAVAALAGHPERGIERDRLIDAGLTADDCRTARKLEWSAKVHVKVTKGLTREGLRVQYRAAASNAQIGRLAMFWRALEGQLDGTAERNGLAKVELQDKDGATYRGVRLFGLAEIHADWASRPTLYLDAKIEPTLLKARVPHAEIVAEIVATQNTHVVQIPDKVFGKAGFHDADYTSRVWHWSLAHARKHGGNWLVVVPKLAEDQLVKTETIPSFMGLTHFGALRGLDRWKDVNGIIVVGRTMPPTWGVELTAGILTGEEVEPLDGYYPQTPVTLRAKNGQAVTVEAERHPNDLAEAVRRSICDGELIQAIGRGRAVSRHMEAPLEVVLLGNAAVPGLEIDEIGTWSKPDADTRAWAELGVVLSSAADMAKVIGTNVKALTKARSRLETFSIENLFIGNVAKLAVARYQRKGPGTREGSAIYDPRTVPDIQAWLSARLGPVEVFDAGQDEGRIARVGNPHDSNSPTLGELNIPSQRVSEWRETRDAGQERGEVHHHGNVQVSDITPTTLGELGLDRLSKVRDADIAETLGLQAPLEGYRGGKIKDEDQVYVRDRLAAAGIGHDALAGLVGISRPQLTNAINGTYGLSADAAERLVAAVATLPVRQARLWL